MKLTQLRYFQAVGKYKNFTRAAEEMHVSQPSITVAVKELEKELNIDLLQRNSKKVTLTAEGQYFLNQSSEILDKLDFLVQEMKDKKDCKNYIKLGLPLQIGTYLMPILLDEFNALYPEIHLDICERGALELSEMVRKEELDLAVLGEDEEDGRGLVWKVLRFSQVCFCVSKKHPLAARTSIKLSEVAEEPVVMLSKGYYINRVVQRNFNKIGEKMKVILYTDQLHTLKNLVSCGAAVSYLLKEGINDRDNIVAIPIEGFESLRIAVIWKSGRYLFNDSKKLINFIVEKFAE